MFSRSSRGFTLIEVMIVVAIVGILVAIAYPSYQGYLIRNNRNIAKGDLLELQQWMERNYTLTNNYSISPGGGTITISSLPYSASPRTGTSHYTITFSAGPSATAYTLSAAPTGSLQVKDTTCGTLTLDSAGIRGAKGSAGNVTVVNNCWDR